MKKFYLSALACAPLTEYLRSLGADLHFMNGENTPVYDAVKTHADIHMCQLGLWEKSRLFLGNTSRLGSNYPGNIIYNAVCTGKYFIHNLKYTDPELLDHANSTLLELINVPQGYTRCCCLPVDDRSFITSDHGIAKALAFYNTDVLLIEKGHIALPGFDYGFIGGCCGHVLDNDGRRVIVFNGDLTTHPDHPEIISFIEERDITPVWFEGELLMDIGSILVD